MAGKWIALSGDTIRNQETLTALNMDHVADVRFGRSDKATFTFDYGHAMQVEEADAEIIRKWLNDEMLEEAGEVEAPHQQPLPWLIMIPGQRRRGGMPRVCCGGGLCRITFSMGYADNGNNACNIC